MTSFLLKSGSLEVLTRSELDAIVKESRFADSDLADPGQLAKIAQLKIADYLVAGEITHFDNRTVSTGTEIAGATSGKQRQTIQFNLRLIDVKTGKVIAEESMRQQMESTDIPAQLRLNWTEADYANAFLEKVAVAAGGYIGYDSHEKIYTANATAEEAALALAARFDAGACDVLLVICGVGSTREGADRLYAELSDRYRRTEVILIDGGQAVEDYIMVFE